MPPAERRKPGRKTKSNTFRKGHQPWNKEKKLSLSNDVCNTALTSVTRPDMTVYKATSKSYDGPPNTVPWKLRPKKQITDLKETCEDSSENIIVNFTKLQDCIKLCMRHNCKRPDSVNTSIVHRKGMCISLQTKCNRCSFDTKPCKLYTECIKQNRGPAAGCLNEGLSMATLKSKMGGSDVQMLMACLDIRSPCLTNVNNKKITKQCEKMVVMNENTMMENQKFVADVATCLGKGNLVDVERDTCYNNRNQTGYEAASQSFSPIIEKMTGYNLPVAMATANKICSKINSCNHDVKKCSLTYNTDESISSSEAKLANKNLEKIHSAKLLTINSVTSDVSAQIGKVVREFGQKNGKNIKYFQCFVHRLHTLQKKVKSICFSKLLPGYQKDIFQQKLATCVRSWVRLELVRIQKTHTSDTFAPKALLAVKNMIDYFSRSHSRCGERSFVCRANTDSFNTQFLPYGQYLELAAEDRGKIESVLSKSLSLEVLNKISLLYTTNQWESLHHRFFTYAPKSVLYKRNFNGLCHSACHSATFGTGRLSVL
ncbi:uncharacterized protein LOC134256626 [Saccostrea cucullata]|uniref:uncharacterized protein LOC134256626 n=1 Tax=Saccostrea cuccullata TaxID=36930 RepID=UPI002ED2F16D